MNKSRRKTPDRDGSSK